jgi:DNA-binding NtrC family response regulator
MSVSKGRILIIDDDEDIREVLGDRLASQGFEVGTASNGVEGLRRLRGEDVEVVLLDLQMPEMDGMAVLRRIEEEDLDTTVVVITAYGSIERAVKAMKAGAFDFICALEQTGGDRSRAAELLGLQRTYLVRLIRTLNV